MSLLAESVSGYLENASWIRRMFEAGGQLKARYGAENVYDFSLGNPDLPAPATVGEGLRRFAEHAGEPFAFGYMPNAGFPWAREQLAAHLSKEQGVALEANDVLLTCGAAGGLNAFLRAVINPGEKMLTFAPYFVEYGFYVANHGGSLQAIMSKPGTFEPDLDALEEAIDEKTRVVLINSPHNPTGVVYSRKAVTSLCRLLENKSEQYGHPIWLIADEPYRFLTYDGVEVPSVLPLYQYAVVISSFSKNLSLPGERVGYVAVSPKLADRARLMAGLTLTNRILGFVNPPVVGQHIMAAALGSQVDVEVYARRRPGHGRGADRCRLQLPDARRCLLLLPAGPRRRRRGLRQPSGGRTRAGRARFRFRLPRLFPPGLLRGRDRHPQCRRRLRPRLRRGGRQVTSFGGGRACAFPPFLSPASSGGIVSRLLSLFVLLCCLLLPAAGILARDVGPDEARQVLARPPAGLVVLDIRTPEEFRDGHLPGARNLDFFAPDFRQQLEALARKDVPILLYCRSGNRSGQAMRLLRQWGRDDVLHLADGFRSWRAAGLPEE